MSVATSLPCVRIPHTSSQSPSSSSSASTTNTTSSCLRLSTTSRKPCYLSVRSSQAEGPVRRPVAPSPTPPLKPNPPPTPTPSSPPVPPTPTQPAASQVVVEDQNVVTSEFQRQKAKKLQDYFKKKMIEESNQGPFFGFIAKNEISNGRWAMFGFAVGMLTEYATGSDFVDQLKILLSNFGILDLE